MPRNKKTPQGDPLPQAYVDYNANHMQQPNLETLLDMLQEQNNILANLQREIAEIRIRNEALEQRVSLLETDNQALRADNQALREEQAEIKAENRFLRKEIGTLRESDTQLRVENQVLYTELDTLKLDVRNLKGWLEFMQDSEDGYRAENHRLWHSNFVLQDRIETEVIEGGAIS